MISIRGPATALPSVTPDEKVASEVAAAILGMPIAAEAASMVTVLRLSRDQAAKYLCTLGYEISANRLAKLAVHGGGPEYKKWGRRVVYCPLKLLEWAKSRESAGRFHTSEGTLLQTAA
jgi:hypothetical protein